MKLCRKIFEIEGIVQGVGFRPAVYCLAIDASLGGGIRNCSGNVLLVLEGESRSIDAFIVSLPDNLPAQARIDKIQLVESKSVNNIFPFNIQISESDSNFKVSIPADLAMCSDCEKEISDPNNRRYRYPFTTCVNCGPRYTVVNSMPYDRCRTTLADFLLCSACKEEYIDHKNRRFHAESIACPVCGPKLFLTNSNGKEMNCSNPLGRAITELANGKIVAIRGIGGFLLAADASNRDAIGRLRERKKRPHKPFAVMARNMDVVKKHCKVSELEEASLKSVPAPIVILDISQDSSLPMDLISPDTNTLGVMLPYSPLHKLLFENPSVETRGACLLPPKFDFIIMTSGNRGGEPICIKNEKAFERLADIADYMLCHNREINLRNDDSLCTIQNGLMQIWRRARGFAPEAIKIKMRSKKTVLAMGAELKNCIALGYDKEVVVSPHIGDLETPEAVDDLRHAVKCFPNFLKKQPNAVAVDLHPDMHSTRVGIELAGKLNVPVVKVQHHHAHAVSCMTENNLTDALALVFDGTGLGTDGTIWGAELLDVKENGFTRLATFEPVPMPGGDAAVYNPTRQLVGRFSAAGMKMSSKMLADYGISDEEYNIWKMQCTQGVNAPLTHAAGRLFDSFAALINVAPTHMLKMVDFSKIYPATLPQIGPITSRNLNTFRYITYEGQAAIRLEAEAKRAMYNNEKLPSLPFNIIEKGDMLYIDWSEMFSSFISQDKHNFAPSILALSFHKTVARAAVKMLEFGLSKTSTRNVVLTGGVFMNKILTRLLAEEIKRMGLNVYIHKKIPPNDGGISLGQAVIGLRVSGSNNQKD